MRRTFLLLHFCLRLLISLICWSPCKVDCHCLLHCYYHATWGSKSNRSPACSYMKKISTRAKKRSERRSEGGDSWLRGQMVTRRGLTAVCVCVSRLQCVYVQEKERKIGTDCIQHLSSVDLTTKERARQHGQHQTGRVRSRKEARNERQGCSGRRRASEEKRKTLTHKNRLRKIKDTGGNFPPMFRVEDDICSPKNKVCSVSVCLYPSARYVCICVRYMRSSLIGSAGRCATEGESTIGCVKTQSASAAARACREGRLVHVHARTDLWMLS